MKPLKTRFKRKASSSLTPKIGAGSRSVLMSFLPYVLSLALAGLFLGSVVAYALNSPAFILNEVRILNVGKVTPEQAFKFSELRKGENIIQLDLAGVEQVIKAKHPEFKEVRVKRVLPNRIDIELRRRTPIAQVYFSRYVQMDRDRVLMPGSSATPFNELLIIEGAPLPKGGVAVGSVLSDPGTDKALKLVSAALSFEHLKKHKISKVDIADPRNISLYMNGSIEVKLGGSHFIDRLKLLNEAVRTMEFEPSKIRYIDLRFDNVIIGPR